MVHPAPFAAPLVAACLAGHLVQPIEPPMFLPKAGEEVERTIRWTESINTVESRILENGEDSVNAPVARTDVSRSLEIVSRDTYAASGANEVQELVRRYDELTLETSATIAIVTQAGTGEIDVEGEGYSELEGVGVRFKLDEDGSMKTTFADDYEGSEELIEGLLPNGEFIALLPDPEKEIETDDEWEVDLDLLDEILRPGGTFPFTIETDLQAIQGVMDPLLLPGPFQCLDGTRAGEINARAGAVKDGMFPIHFTVDVRVDSDQAEKVEVAMEPAVPDEVIADLTAASYGVEIDGKGTLFWDLEANRLRSLEFEADVTVEVDLEVAVEAEGESLAFDFEESREGTIGLTIE